LKTNGQTVTGARGKDNHEGWNWINSEVSLKILTDEADWLQLFHPEALTCAIENGELRIEDEGAPPGRG